MGTVSLLAQMLFPSRCALCHVNGTALCEICLDALPLTESQLELPNIDFINRGFNYAHNQTRFVIKQAKLHNQKELVTILTDHIVHENLEPLTDFIRMNGITHLGLVPIPSSNKQDNMTPKRMAQAIRQCLDIPVSVLDLKQTRTTSKQALLSKQARKHNVKHSLSLQPPKEAIQHIMIIDDIITTGATLTEAARACQKTLDQLITCSALTLAHS